MSKKNNSLERKAYIKGMLDFALCHPDSKVTSSYDSGFAKGKIKAKSKLEKKAYVHGMVILGALDEKSKVHKSLLAGMDKARELNKNNKH